MRSDMLHSQFKHACYWHEAAPRRIGPFAELPKTVDMLVIGSGYTGLSAARTLARSGREVVVLDAGLPGDGASSRNAGFIGTHLLTPFSALRRSLGLEKSIRAYGEAKRAFDFTVDLIKRESLDCGYEQHGRIYWAYTKDQLSFLKTELEDLKRHLGKQGEVVGPDHESGESGSHRYCGGIVLPDTGALHAGKWHEGLMGLAEAAGVTIIGETAVTRIGRLGTGQEVTTNRGTIAAREVIVATNGYIGSETPSLRRRVLSVTTQMSATEPLSTDIARQIVPTLRTHIDTRSMAQYWRLSPDKTRLLFCGRTALPSKDPIRAASAHHRSIVALFPQLAGTRITHYWSGKLGLTYDRMPHIGSRDGIHYALGMNGAGVAMGAYVGHCIASRLLGHSDGDSIFAEGSFDPIPLNIGKPWFVPLLGWLALMKHQFEVPPGHSRKSAR